MKKRLLGLLAILLSAAPSAARAERSFPYGCEWISEVSPDAVIRFSSTNGTGVYNGALIYRGKRLMAFQEGQSQGYGSHWWSTGRDDDPSGRVVVFAGHQVVRGTIGFWNGRKPDGPQRVLLVGLGAALYYGQDPLWRNDSILLTAGEGFWRSTPGCRVLL